MFKNSGLRRSRRPLAFGKIVTLALAAFLSVGCANDATSGRQTIASGAPSRTLQELNGAHVAMPIGLFLASLDADRDLRVSRTEASDGAAATFKAGDVDGNGLLSPLEYEDWSLKHFGATQTTPGRLQLDRDQDLRISPQEFTLGFAAIHNRLDADQDGYLARAELLNQINGLGVDPQALRAEIEAEMRREMQGKIREICQRSRRT